MSNWRRRRRHSASVSWSSACLPISDSTSQPVEFTADLPCRRNGVSMSTVTGKLPLDEPPSEHPGYLSQKVHDQGQNGKTIVTFQT